MLDGLHVLPPKHDDNMPSARVVPRAMEGFLVIVHKSFESFLLHQPPHNCGIMVDADTPTPFAGRLEALRESRAPIPLSLAFVIRSFNIE